MPARLDFTVSDVTVDELYEELGKLREIGWGKSSIEWHTSRSHLGKQITMTLSTGESKSDHLLDQLRQEPG
jgi:hypothetical protein